MKFSIKRDELITIFSEFINILKENPIKPIISGLKIEAKRNEIIFLGTNVDVNYIRILEGEIKEEGEVIFKPQLALEYIKLLDEEFLNLEFKDGVLKIHFAEFSVLEGEGFPQNLIMPLEKEIMKIKPEELYNGFDKTKFSASLSAENIAINCVRVIFSTDRVSFVSTDSYRMTYLRTQNIAKENLSCSIPLESINIIMKLIKDLNVEITIGISGENIIFLWNNSYFLTKLITVQFPNFESILVGNSFSKEMEFNYNDFKSSLKKVMTVAKTSSEAKNGAIFEFKGKKLNLSASSGRAKINQKVDMIKNGEDFKCSLNIKYLYEYIENVSKNIVIRGNNSSAMFEITEAGNEYYKYILMPLALRE